MAEGSGNLLHVELVSPEQILYSGEAQMVLARTVGGGDIAFLPGHAPFIGALQPCVVRVLLPGGKEERAAVYGGFVEVSHNRVSVLSDEAELAGRIDVAAARAAKEAAERGAAAGDADAIAALRRAQVALDAAGAPAGAGHAAGH